MKRGKKNVDRCIILIWHSFDGVGFLNFKISTFEGNGLKASWVLWYIFCLIKIKSLKFNELMGFVVKFSISLCMLDLNNKCDYNDVLYVRGYIVKVEHFVHHFKALLNRW